MKKITNKLNNASVMSLVRRVLSLVLTFLLLAGSCGVPAFAKAYADLEEDTEANESIETVASEETAVPLEQMPDISEANAPQSESEAADAPEALEEPEAGQEPEAAEEPEAGQEPEAAEEPEAGQEPVAAEEAAFSADLTLDTHYTTITIPGGSDLSFEPVEIPAQQFTLPAVESGEIRLAEAWSFLDCDDAAVRVELKVSPRLAENEELILCALQHQWYDLDGNPVADENESRSELCFFADEAMYRQNVISGYQMTIDSARFSGFALLVFTPAAEETAADSDEAEAIPEAETEPAEEPVESTTLTAGDKHSYEVTATYSQSAGIPMSGTKLVVKELHPGDEGYADYLAQSAEQIGVEESSLTMSRVFDISIVDTVDSGIVYEPTGYVDVSIRLFGEELDQYENLDVLHFVEDEDSDDVSVYSMGSDVDGEELSFTTDGFSVYVIVSGPEPVSVTVETVKTLSELAAHLNQGFKLSVNREGKTYYFTNLINGKNAFIETTSSADAADWFFQAVEGQQNTYRLFTKIQGEVLYVTNPSGNLIGLSRSLADAIVLNADVVPSREGTFYLYHGNRICLQHSNGGNGIRFYQADNNENSYITISYSDSFLLPKDPYSLDGVTHGLLNYKGGTDAYALMGAAGGTQGKKLYVRSDPMDRSGSLYVAKDSEISLWSFVSVAEDRYYLSTQVDGAEKYLSVGASSLTLKDSADASCEIQVVPGSGANKGQIRLIGVESGKSVKYNAGGFVSANLGSDSNYWLNFADLSVYSEEDFVPYAAKKVSVSDNVNVTTGKQVVIYTRTWNESAKQYEFYAVDHNGDLVPCYESGDDIIWIGAKINTLLWNFTEKDNDYYELQNDYSGVYLAPRISGSQVFSGSPFSVNLSGRQHQDYYTTILAWDDPYYDYACIRTENGSITADRMSKAQQFYFAVMQLSEGTLTPVATVDHTELGMTMKMVDFGNTDDSGLVKGSGATSPTTSQQLSVMGTQAYTETAAQSGLLSSGISGSVDGYPTATITGKSLSELYAGATTVNHLFIQSIYDGSGYYEFDSTKNFAQLTGNSFTVYEQLGTVTGTSETRRHSQFMPYNSLDLSKAHSVNPVTLTDIFGRNLSDDDPLKGRTLYGFNEKENHYFGMEITGHFMQTPNGHDAWGHDLIFEFVGDDDFWLYVDGELVIDLGGIHKALYGSVNYSTGLVVVNGQQTTLYDLFKAHFEERGESGATLEDHLNSIFTDTGKTITVGNTVKPVYVFQEYSTHTIRIFYMERGGGASNLRMRFNLASVTPGEVLLSKEISGTDKQDFSSAEFAFQIYCDAVGNGNYSQLGEHDQSRVVYQNTSTPVSFAASKEIDGYTYSNVFLLKPGQTAAIQVPDGTIQYYIRECGVNSGIYDSATVNDIDVPATDPTETVTGSPSYIHKCFQCPPASVEQRGKVVFNNHVSENSLRILTITKKLFDENGNPLSATDDPTGFRCRIYFGDPLAYYSLGDYQVKSPEGYYCTFENGRGFVSTGKSDFSQLSPEQQSAATFYTSASGAADKLPSGYSIEIRDLLVDTKFKVVEESYDIPLGYGPRTWTEPEGGSMKTFTCYKRVASSYVTLEGEGENTGIIRESQYAKIELHNQRGYGIRADKVWSDSDFIRTHGDVYFAVFVGDSVEPLAGSVRRIDSYNYTTYYFQTLESGAALSDYHVCEVALTDPSTNASGNITYSDLEKLNEQVFTVSGCKLKNGEDAGALQYHVSYSQGAVVKSVDTLSHGNTRIDTVRNTRVGGLTVRKTAMDGTTGLAGAVIEVKQGETLIGRYTSDIDGLFTTLYLENGSYTLNEVKAPATYQAMIDELTITADNGSYSFSENENIVFDSTAQTLTIKNKPFTLSVIKVSSNSREERIADAHFALYRQVQGHKDYFPLEAYSDLVSDSNGLIAGISETLAPGTYYLVETQAPDGYKALEQDLVITISPRGEVTIDQAHADLNWLDEQNTTNSVSYKLYVQNSPDEVPLPTPTGYTGARFTSVYLWMLLLGVLTALLGKGNLLRRGGRDEAVR